MEIKVSIITVCLNSEKTIERTLRSVESQTYTNIEYIIVDGGSNDSTLEIIEMHRNKLPQELMVISEADNGIYDAMNKGIKLAKGDVIGILNSDDWYEKDTVEKTVSSFMDGNDKCISYGAMRFWEDDVCIKELDRLHDELKEDMIFHPTCFVSRKVYEEIGLFNTKYHLAADYDFMVRALKRGIEFRHIACVLANFSINGASETHYTSIERLKIRYSNGFVSKSEYVKKMIACRLKYSIWG